MLRHSEIRQYFYLMRLHKPIGMLLLLWPTLWALWLASGGQPSKKNVFIFIAGVILMRSAGCILNDFADRHFDKHVTRTRERPLAAGKIGSLSALCLAVVLCSCAFLLVLFCNLITIKLAFIGAALTVLYPFMKRYTHLPQVGLGMAFAWGVPMAFAAETGTVTAAAWALFLTAAIWPIIYDTMYAMVDREDDIKIGVKSTAILFADKDCLMIACLQVFFIALLMSVGFIFHLQQIYYASLLAVAVLFLYQQWLIKNRDPQNCFKAFLNNNWVGASIFFAILMGQ